jgi:hypothetical protein
MGRLKATWEGSDVEEVRYVYTYIYVFLYMGLDMSLDMGWMGSVEFVGGGGARAAGGGGGPPPPVPEQSSKLNRVPHRSRQRNSELLQPRLFTLRLVVGFVS